MTHKELKEEIDKLRAKYNYILFSLNTSIDNEIATHGGSIGDVLYKSVDISESILKRDLDNFKIYMEKMINNYNQYGQNSYYKQAYRFFTNFNTLAHVMSTPDKLIIDRLIDKYGEYKTTIHLMAYEDRPSTNMVGCSDEPDSANLITMDNLMAKLPYPHRSLVSYMSACLIKDIVESTTYSAKENNYNLIRISKIYQIIKEELLVLLSPEVDDTFKKYAMNINTLTLICNHYTLLYLIIPDYSQINSNNISEYKEYWPFSSKGILEILAERLVKYRLDRKKLDKLCLMGIEGSYMGMPIIEALSIRALYDLAHEILTKQ